MAGYGAEELIDMTLDTSESADVFGALREIMDTATVTKVFGAPITHDGMIVLPVAALQGGGGGGSGTTPSGEAGSKESGSQESGSKAAGSGSGTGGGFGLSARALGVFVIKDGTVEWRPAVDVNRVLLTGGLVAVTALLLVRDVIKARARRAA
jgi:uncharacterized spore protein YtfJ